MARLTDTVAVVTGGGRGIGREIALQQAREGEQRWWFLRTLSEIEETVALVQDEGGQAIALAVDVTDYIAVESTFNHISAELGFVDTLVNNHGSFQAFGPVWEVEPLAGWRDIETNLQETFHT